MIPQNLPPEPNPSAEPDMLQINPIDLLNILLKRRKLIVLGALSLFLLTGIYTKLCIPRFYAATAQFLPSKDPDMTARMGSLIGSPSAKLDVEEGNYTSDYYKELLASPAFLERLAVRKFRSVKAGGEVDLYAYYEIDAPTAAQRRDDVCKAIADALKVTLARQTKIISLEYTTQEPALSADILNGLLDELAVYSQIVKGAKARLKRDFIEKQVTENQGLLRGQEAKLADFIASNRKIVTPDIELELDRLKRAVRVQEEVYITLKRQLELTKIEEQEQRPVLDIIQPATAPYYKKGPSAVKNAVIAGFVSVILLSGLAFALELWGKLGQLDQTEPRNRELLQYVQDIQNDLRRLLRLRKK